jgi:flagellar assembly protein FliH
LSNKVIPKEHVTRVSKVELGDLAGARRASSAPGAPAPDTAALEQARARGYEQGLAEGRKRSEDALDADRAELKTLVAGVSELMRDFEQGLANDVLSLSLELAKLIVRTSLRVKPDLVIAVVREAVGGLPGVSEQTTLFVNPADAALLRELAPADPQFNALAWKLVEDPQLERGGCRIATPATEIDATLETRWRRVIASLGRDDAWIDITI